MRMINLNSRKSQSELITSVLLILVTIAAVAIVASFVFNLVKNNLKGTDCLQTVGQFTINPTYSYFNSSSSLLYVSINRAEKSFNLTGIKLVYGNAQSSKSVNLLQGVSIPGIYNLKMDGTFDTINTSIVLPDVGTSKAYVLNTSSFGSTVNKISIYPILSGNQNCDLADDSPV